MCSRGLVSFSDLEADLSFHPHSPSDTSSNVASHFHYLFTSQALFSGTFFCISLVLDALSTTFVWPLPSWRPFD